MAKWCQDLILTPFLGQRCVAAAEAWHPDRLLPRFEEFLLKVMHSSGHRRLPLACG
jgi:hypothetical protein